MVYVGTRAQKTIEKLVAMAKDGYVKINNAPGSFMPVSVEMLCDDIVSIAHYYEQNGDLMADPEMTFWRGPDGRYYPMSFRNDGTGTYDVCLFLENGKPQKFFPRMQADSAQFTTIWMRNIRDQQGI